MYDRFRTTASSQFKQQLADIEAKHNALSRRQQDSSRAKIKAEVATETANENEKKANDDLK